MPVRSGLGKSRCGHDAESDDEKRKLSHGYSPSSTFDVFSNRNPSVITQSRTGKSGRKEAGGKLDMI
jgi:hypothetical protein